MVAQVGKTELEYAKEFWTLANIITAFAVFQMIAYLFSAGANDSKIRSGIIQIRRAILVGIVVATLLYSIGVWLLGNWQIELLERNGLQSLSYSLRWVQSGRVVVIGLSGVVGFCVTLILRPNKR